MNRLPDRETCEDLCSEIFIDAIEALNKFKAQKGARFGSLLYRIASFLKYTSSKLGTYFLSY
ncbi:hypothetical protein GF389_02715 [Candidatus Dojkabacteria bacterium]|nr:hypothetical protein [Candidatus Dojkabacteria bacterium]